MNNFILCITVSAYSSLCCYALPAEPDYLLDEADLLTPSQERTLIDTLKGFNDQGLAELKVAILNNYSRYGIHNFEKFSMSLFNDWGIGTIEENNGVLLLIVKQERKMRIQLGSGFPESIDSSMLHIIQNDLVPAFKAKQFDKGINHGVDGIIAFFSPSSSPLVSSTGKATEPSAGYASSTPIESIKPEADAFELLDLNTEDKQGPIHFVEAPVSDFSAKQDQGVDSAVIRNIGLGGGITAIIGTLVFAVTRPRKCRKCKCKVIKLSEAEEDDFLSEKQQFEEEIGSTNYNVWECPQCKDLKLSTSFKLFSKYSSCPKCNTKALSSTSITVKRPTRYSKGLKRITSCCSYCDHSFVNTRTIARLPEPRSHSGSSASFGGGSSFGGGGSSSGGSSSGGGASGGW